MFALAFLFTLQSCNRDNDEEPSATVQDISSDWENDFTHTISERYSHELVSVNGTPFNPKLHSEYERHINRKEIRGAPTQITVINEGTDLHVFWIDQNQGSAKVSVLDNNLNKTKSVTLIEKSAIITGFTVIPNQGYAVVYTDKDDLDQTNLIITDFTGKVLHEEFVLGNTDRSVRHARWTDILQEGRLSYNKSMERLTFYTAAFTEYSSDPENSDVHQGGFLKFFDKSGNTTFTDDLLYGHIFGIKLVELNDVSVMGILGDSRPLGVSCVTFLPHNLSNEVEVFKCSEGLFNTIETRIGDVVPFPEADYYAVSYAGQEVVASTESFDVGVSFYTPSGMRMSNIILPRPEGKEGKACGINPLKTARFGDDKVLLAWVEKEWDNPEEIGAYFAIVNASGELLLGPEPMGDLAFHKTDDFFVYPDGNVGWVDGDGSQLRFHTIRVK